MNKLITIARLAVLLAVVLLALMAGLLTWDEEVAP